MQPFSYIREHRKSKETAFYLLNIHQSQQKNKERKGPHQFPWPYLSLSCETSSSLTQSQLVFCAVINKKKKKMLLFNDVELFQRPTERIKEKLLQISMGEYYQKNRPFQ